MSQHPTYPSVEKLIAVTDGTNSYLPFLTSTLALASAVDPSTPHGYISEVIGHAWFGELFAGAAPAAVPPLAGPVPPLPTTADGDRAVRRQAEEAKKRADYEVAMRICKVGVVAALNADTITALENPNGTGLINVSLPTILQYARQQYGTVSQLRKTKNVEDMRKPYDPSSGTIRSHISALTALHRFAAQNMDVQSESAKVGQLIASARTCGKYDTTLDNFIEAFPHAPSFAVLAERLILADENKRLSQTTGSTGFGNAATNNVADLERRISEMSRLIAQMEKGKGKEKEKVVDKTQTRTCQECTKPFTSPNKRHIMCKSCHDVHWAAKKGNGDK